MVNYGKVLELFVSLKGKNRENRSSIDLDENGVIDDKFYAKDNIRSVLIASKESYKIASGNQIEIKYGVLGENILIDINPYNLNFGDKILIGAVELQITQNCTMCNTLAKIDKKLPKVLKNDRGIFAQIIKSGKIKKGDKVQILPNKT
jgi:MOSC domain-containing protein YiiM